MGFRSWSWTAQSPSLDIPNDPGMMKTIREYFGTVGLFWPCLHEDSFVATYEQNRSNGFRNVRRSWLALVYIVLAYVNCTRTAASPSSEDAELSETLFQKALAVALPEAIMDTSLESSEQPPLSFTMSINLLNFQQYNSSASYAVIYKDLRIPPRYGLFTA